MKIDANTILREQGADALRNVIDNAVPFKNAGRTYPDDLDPATVPARVRFLPVAIDDVAISPEPIWLIDGLLPARGLAFIVGPPKSGKSFLTSDMLCSVARGALYAGRQTLQGSVVYLTGEGVKGFERRLIAMRQHLEIEGQGVPFFMVDRVPDLGSEATDLPQFIADLAAFIALHCPEGVKAIALDTLARCMGAADESSARDMGRFIERCAAIERHFKCLVVVVHHVGKDATRGGAVPMPRTAPPTSPCWSKNSKPTARSGSRK